MTIRGMWGLAVALLAGLVACSDAPRPRVSSEAAARTRADTKSSRTAVRPTGGAVIDVEALERGGASAVGSEQRAAEVGALPPELLAILHQGPGGRMQYGDDIGLEFESGGGMEGAVIAPGAPSIVDDRALAPAGDVEPSLLIAQ